MPSLISSQFCAATLPALTRLPENHATSRIFSNAVKIIQSSATPAVIMKCRVQQGHFHPIAPPFALKVSDMDLLSRQYAFYAALTKAGPVSLTQAEVNHLRPAYVYSGYQDAYIPALLRRLPGSDSYRVVNTGTGGDDWKYNSIDKDNCSSSLYVHRDEGALPGGMMSSVQGISASGNTTDSPPDSYIPLYQELSSHPGVSKFRDNLWDYDTTDYSYFRIPRTLFINFKLNTPDKEQIDLSGDKWHISVHIDDVPAAFNLLASTLLRKDSPVTEWKVTDMSDTKIDNESVQRVRRGAQFTLYFRPEQEQGYSADYLARIKKFGETLDQRLLQGGIRAGVVPDSDIVMSHYRSYRNDKLIPANDSISPQERELLCQQIFLQATVPDS